MSRFPQQLFPPVEERAEADRVLSGLLWEAYQRANLGSVVPTFDGAQFQDELATFDFGVPRPLDHTLRWTVDQMERGLVHITHPRYFGLFNPPPTFPSQCADRIAALFNPQLATYITSPAAVGIEAHTIRAVARRVGLPKNSFGHFTTGGAEANYTALLVALTRACPDFAADGARAFRGRPTLYISADSHLAWLKIAHQAGIGRASVRLVPTNGLGQMDTGLLAKMISEDRADGCKPVMVVATAGTTNAGMIDPLHACARLAHSLSVWLHVDAAWGGGIIASDVYAHVLGGIERADSITIDAHKWFATTMGCGMFLTRHADMLPTTFHVDTSYMPSKNRDDPYVTSLQWSRRFVGLRLFLSLATVGWKGYGDHVEHAILLAEKFHRDVEAKGWNVVNRSPLGVVCVRSTKPARDVVDLVLASGRAWVSVAAFEGEEIVRICITSGETTEQDVSGLIRQLHISEKVLSQ